MSNPENTSLKIRKAGVPLESEELKKKPKNHELAQDKWWKSQNEKLISSKDEKKWDYLEHHGVTFPAFYEPHNLKLIYKGEHISVNPEVEEICYYWA